VGGRTNLCVAWTLSQAQQGLRVPYLYQRSDDPFRHNQPHASAIGNRVLFRHPLSLAFLFLLLSVVASSFQELVAQYTHLRAKNLKQALERLVTVPSIREGILQHSLVTSLSNKS